ncbi:MAG: DUF11 domain-containing protein [Actinomycetota bacterium]|nr:DUF11 domain-containing protein [Actinomycetota bacterium]
MTPLRLALALAVSALVFVPSTASRVATVSATGVISGSGTSYTLVVTNTGTETIRCMRFFAATGVRIVSATGPGTTSASGNAIASLGVLAAPGAAATYTFTTDVPYPPNAGGELRVSADCIGDVATRATGPSAAPTPCRCLRLEGQIVPRTIAFTNPGERGGMHLEFTVAWTLICTPGSGGCNGQLELFPPQPARALKSRLKPISGRIACVGQCGGTATGSKKFVLTAGPALGGHRRGSKVKSISLRMRRTCQGARTTDRVFKLVFAKTGLVDKKKSDLNG